MEACDTAAVAALLEDEWYLVRDSGELPETAFHSSLYYLTSHPDGPQLQLDEMQRHFLFQAAVSRFVEIILRDLDFTARMSPAARGLGRAIINYRRLALFCRRQGKEECLEAVVRDDLRAGLAAFLCSAEREPGVVVNCTLNELRAFAVELGVSLPFALGDIFVFSA